MGYIREGDSLSEQLQQALEDTRLDWDEKQQREMERKVAQIPNPKDVTTLRNDLMKRYRALKKDFLSGLENAQKIANWTPFDQNAQSRLVRSQIHVRRRLKALMW